MSSADDRRAPSVVRAIVVHHDQPDRAATTVSHLLAQGVPIDVVIVDNASSPVARARLSTLLDERLDAADSTHVQIVDAGENLGFGGGANVGLRAWMHDGDASAPPWALVVPHDAEPAADCLRRMLDAIDEVEAGDPSRRVGLASAEFGLDEVPVIDRYFGGLSVAAERDTGFVDTDYAHGTFLLLSRSCLREIGLFDETYFAYCEEADLALRARAVGWRTGMVWGAVVANPHQGNPSPAVDYLMVRNTVALVRTHFGRYRGFVRLALEVLTLPWSAMRPQHRSPWFDARARVLAVRDALLHRTGPPPRSLSRRVVRAR